MQMQIEIYENAAQIGSLLQTHNKSPCERMDIKMAEMQSLAYTYFPYTTI